MQVDSKTYKVRYGRVRQSQVEENGMRVKRRTGDLNKADKEGEGMHGGLAGRE